MSDIQIKTVTGTGVLPWLEPVARLRIRVFREFPYLYDGEWQYERDYLAAYAESPDSVVVLALEGDTVVGASTGLPLVHADPAFQAPFPRHGFTVDEVFYLGESVLDTAYRGRGLGHAFFDAREQHARQWGARHTSFCAVIRPPDHPLRPADYRPLDPFWRGRGYQPVAGMEARFPWKECGEAAESTKSMQFWVRTD
jgi:GNAT superfamily N-acetyltransferase